MKQVYNHPKILLVGRTNVGKSTLFNRIIGAPTSIALDQDGVTRDYLEHNITWQNNSFTLVDTGGLMLTSKLKGQAKDLQDSVHQNVFATLSHGAVILFVCDGKNGLTLEDKRIAKILHKSNQKVIVVINKADNINALQQNLYEFNQLGFSNIQTVSAIHGTGIPELLTSVSQNITTMPKHHRIKSKQSKNIVIIGKPNVGKSSLMNLLTQKQRSIVSNVAGTTREAISETIFHSNDLLQITDTAGLRKKSRVKETLETLMTKSSLSSIRQSDIIVLMLDASEGHISDQELKLLFYGIEQHKPIIILYNKVDLLTEDDDYKRMMLLKDIEEYDFILKKIPQIAISCISKKNVHKVLQQIENVLQRCQQKFDTVELDEYIKGELTKKPLYHKRVLLRLFSIKQRQDSIPAFTLRVNFPEWFGPTQLGFIENTLRRRYDLEGCPVRFSLSKSNR